jgi:hypothetical protein
MPAAWITRVTAASMSKARAACSLGQVRGECLALRVHHSDPFGTWGGSTERQRHKVRSVA